MRFDVMTLFCDMLRPFVDGSILGRARAKGLFTVELHDIRDYTTNRQNCTDDYPYGGGRGMLMTAQPVCSCFEAVCEKLGRRPHVIYLSPKGRQFTQDVARELLRYEDIALLCGHYEGIDQRALDMIVDEEISLGDFVLTGGELGAAAVIDCVARMLPGVLADDSCFEEESIYSGLLEYPHYTRPAVFEGRRVPDVLLSGNHAKIEAWRRCEALRLTKERRPDLLEKAELTPADKRFLKSL